MNPPSIRGQSTS